MDQQLLIDTINQLFEIEKKVKVNGYERVGSNISKLKWMFENAGFEFVDPTGEMYNETRTDCEATILATKEPYTISECLKPIILKKVDDRKEIVQLARVIVK